MNESLLNSGRIYNLLNITELAKEELTKRAKSCGCDIILSISSGGCSGFQYNLELITDNKQLYNCIESYPIGSGFRLYIDQDSITYVSGMTLKWVDTLSNKGFSFYNPNASSTCGCGKSFSTDL